jgi:signal transduction protein with GAF and PtsI domain
MQAWLEGSDEKEAPAYASFPFHGQGVVGHVGASGEMLNVPDAHLCHAYDPNVDELVYVLPSGHTSICAVPLKDFAGRVIGVLQVAMGL